MKGRVDKSKEKGVHICDFKRLIIGEDYMENIVIRDSILTNELTFQGYKPYADTWDNGTVIVQTYSHMLYDLDPLDFNNHLSARCEEGGINI